MWDSKGEFGSDTKQYISALDDCINQIQKYEVGPSMQDFLDKGKIAIKYLEIEDKLNQKKVLQNSSEQVLAFLDRIDQVQEIQGKLETLYESPEIVTTKDIKDQYKTAIKAISQNLDVGSLVENAQNSQEDAHLMKKNLTNFVLKGNCLN